MLGRFVYLHCTKPNIMATVKLLIKGKKRDLVPVYVRLSAGRNCDLFVKSELTVDPDAWSNKKQGLKKLIKDDNETKWETDRIAFKKYIDTEVAGHKGDFTREWLEGIIYRYHHKKEVEAKTLNEYIEQYISKIEAGKLQNKSGKNITIGTARGLRGFQGVFNAYQGVYTAKRLEQLKEDKKTPRRRQIIDFEDITIDFYTSFKSFLTDEGYKPNTVGRFIKQLKYFMAKALTDKKHTNKEFKEGAFAGITEKVFNIRLTPEEVDRIYEADLSHDKRLEVCRDKFIVLCETALRVSDYDKIDVSIRTVEGKRLICLTQTKTGQVVIIPTTRRMEEILAKYKGKLPRVNEVYVNRYIKTICYGCGIREELTWDATKFGKSYSKKEFKWKLVSCHTARRTAATNMTKAGLPKASIMRLTGHTTEKEFDKYVDLTAEEAALAMAQHPYYSQTRLRIAK